ncbi:hypothetical protein CC2G_005284 [Coprinopsis cinerea AmutBmut pab1-1]|nr:hypothetical protein CC2G_005284 [Coprinopsis cinerea AmutBmut pab1-1]
MGLRLALTLRGAWCPHGNTVTSTDHDASHSQNRSQVVCLSQAREGDQDPTPEAFTATFARVQARFTGGIPVSKRLVLDPIYQTSVKDACLTWCLSVSPETTPLAPVVSCPRSHNSRTKSVPRTCIWQQHAELSAHSIQRSASTDAPPMCPRSLDTSFNVIRIEWHVGEEPEVPGHSVADRPYNWLETLGANYLKDLFQCIAKGRKREPDYRMLWCGKLYQRPSITDS